MRILSVRLSRLGVLAALVVATVMLTTSPAGAVNGEAPQSTFVQSILGSLNNTAVLVFVLTVVVVPLLNAALTKPSTSGWFRTVLTLALTGVMAVASWATNLGNVVVDWKSALAIFVGALGVMGGVRNAILKGSIEDKLQTKIPIGIGPTMTPEKAAAAHSNNADLTVPVPAMLAPTMPATGANAGESVTGA